MKFITWVGLARYRNEALEEIAIFTLCNITVILFRGKFFTVIRLALTEL